MASKWSQLLPTMFGFGFDEPPVVKDIINPKPSIKKRDIVSSDINWKIVLAHTWDIRTDLQGQEYDEYDRSVQYLHNDRLWMKDLSSRSIRNIKRKMKWYSLMHDEIVLLDDKPPRWLSHGTDKQIIVPWSGGLPVVYRVIRANKIKDTLKRYLYNPANTGFSRDSLYDKIIRDRYLGISKRDVSKYLLTVDMVQKMKAEFKIPVIKSYRPRYPMHHWQIDLIDTQRWATENKGYRFLFVAIDIFSKFIFVYPLLEKTADAVTKVLLHIFHTTSEIPKIMQHDDGPEFKGALTLMLEEYGIINITNAPYSPQTNGFVENKNKQIKAMIWGYMMSRKTKVYYNIIDRITFNINNTKHVVLGFTPFQIHRGIDHSSVAHGKPRVISPQSHSTHPLYHWVASIIDIKLWKLTNLNYQYIFVVVDVFSKFVYLVPLLTIDVDTVAAALSHIFLKGDIPKILQCVSASKSESSFYDIFYSENGESNRVTRLLDEYNVSLLGNFSSITNFAVECVHLKMTQIKSMIWAYMMSKRTNTYYDLIDMIASNLNSKYYTQSRLKKSPYHIHRGVHPIKRHNLNRDEKMIPQAPTQYIEGVTLDVWKPYVPTSTEDLEEFNAWPYKDYAPSRDLTVFNDNDPDVFKFGQGSWIIYKKDFQKTDTATALRTRKTVLSSVMVDHHKQLNTVTQYIEKARVNYDLRVQIVKHIIHTTADKRELNESNPIQFDLKEWDYVRIAQTQTASKGEKQDIRLQLRNDRSDKILYQYVQSTAAVSSSMLHKKNLAPVYPDIFEIYYIGRKDEATPKYNKNGKLIPPPIMYYNLRLVRPINNELVPAKDYEDYVIAHQANQESKATRNSEPPQKVHTRSLYRSQLYLIKNVETEFIKLNPNITYIETSQPGIQDVPDPAKSVYARGRLPGPVRPINADGTIISIVKMTLKIFKITMANLAIKYKREGAPVTSDNQWDKQPYIDDNQVSIRVYLHRTVRGTRILDLYKAKINEFSGIRGPAKKNQTEFRVFLDDRPMEQHYAVSLTLSYATYADPGVRGWHFVDPLAVAQMYGVTTTGKTPAVRQAEAALRANPPLTQIVRNQFF